MADRTTEGYAQAIVTVARAEDALDRVSDELFRFARAMDGNPELRERLTDPAVDLSTKLAVTTDLLAKQAHPQTSSAIAYVISAGRARQLADIADAVVRLAAEERERTVAEVRTATPLDKAQQARLTEALTKATGKQIEVKMVVDPSVVGGIVARIGDTVIDGTVARRLDDLRARLTAG